MLQKQGDKCTVLLLKAPRGARELYYATNAVMHVGVVHKLFLGL